jgi:hypothetical protein
VTRLAEPGCEAWLRASPLEPLIVAYADKRAGQHLEPMTARFASWHRRYPGGWDDDVGESVQARARELERIVCEAAGVDPADVRRFGWSRRALRDAAA